MSATPDSAAASDSGTETAKAAVREFWEAAACGETLLLDRADLDGFERQARLRYRIEPYIAGFAGFDDVRGRAVLEVGVGLGADHVEFARHGAMLTGVDLTTRAIEMTRRRFAALGLTSDLRVADAENLPFADDRFDLVYSWGVIHHSPDTARAAREILRVLRPGGRFAVMVYQRYSIIGFMLWLRYGLMRARPFTSLDAIYDHYLESPGTKAYTPDQGASLFEGAVDVRVRSVLTHGDLLESDAGQRHRGPLLNIARRIWPRWFIRRFLPDRGLFLLIEGRKRGR